MSAAQSREEKLTKMISINFKKITKFISHPPPRADHIDKVLSNIPRFLDRAIQHDDNLKDTTTWTQTQTTKYNEYKNELTNSFNDNLFIMSFYINIRNQANSSNYNEIKSYIQTNMHKLLSCNLWFQYKLQRRLFYEVFPKYHIAYDNNILVHLAKLRSIYLKPKFRLISSNINLETVKNSYDLDLSKLISLIGGNINCSIDQLQRVFASSNRQSSNNMHAGSPAVSASMQNRNPATVGTNFDSNTTGNDDTHPLIVNQPNKQQLTSKTVVLDKYSNSSKITKNGKNDKNPIAMPSAADDKDICHEECVVCMDNKPMMAFVPCGHLVICEECSDEWKKDHHRCVYCKKRFDHIVKIFMVCN